MTKRHSKADPPLLRASLIRDIREMIETARSAVAAAVNAGLTMLYWRIGERINQEILKGKRADYGAEIVSTVSRQLEREYGSGFSAKNIRHMIRFFEAFPDGRIVSTLSRHLSWSHFKELLYLQKPLQKEFYAEMCRIERWSVRTLRQKIASMLYERTALSRKPDELASLELQSLREEDRMSPDLVFRDPYLLDFRLALESRGDDTSFTGAGALKSVTGQGGANRRPIKRHKQGKMGPSAPDQTA